MATVNRNFTSLFFMGVFLLAYAQNMQIIVGSIGKNISLLGGFLCLALIAYRCKYAKSHTTFIILSLILYIIFMVVAIINEQQVFAIINVLFGIVCVVLMNFGYIFSKNMHFFSPMVNGKVIFFIAIMTIVGVIFFISFQSYLAAVSGQSTRGFSRDSELNPVGLAYIYGLIFLINFSLYQNQPSLKSVPKLLLIVAQIAAFIAIVMTQSRGALLFLVIFIFAYFLFNFKLNKKTASNIMKALALFVLFISVILSLSSSIPVIQDKVSGLKYRFSKLFDSIENTAVVDDSSEIRLQGYNDFFKEIDDIILIGQVDYKPYPHNQFIEIIMRWGTFGLPFLFYSIFCLIKSLKLLSFKSITPNLVTSVVVALFIFSYLQSMTSLSLEINRLMWLGFGFIFGLPASWMKGSKLSL